MKLAKVPRRVTPPYEVQPGDRVLHVVAAGTVTLTTPKTGRELWIKAFCEGVILEGPVDTVERLALAPWASRTLLGDGERWCIH